MKKLDPTMNFPDDVWNRMKAWAAAHVSVTPPPSVEQAAAYVRHACGEITGRADGLPFEVVQFYARETIQMLAQLKNALAADPQVKEEAP